MFERAFEPDGLVDRLFACVGLCLALGGALVVWVGGIVLTVVSIRWILTQL